MFAGFTIENNGTFVASKMLIVNESSENIQYNPTILKLSAQKAMDHINSEQYLSEMDSPKSTSHISINSIALNVNTVKSPNQQNIKRTQLTDMLNKCHSVVPELFHVTLQIADSVESLATSLETTTNKVNMLETQAQSMLEKSDISKDMIKRIQKLEKKQEITHQYIEQLLNNQKIIHEKLDLLQNNSLGLCYPEQPKLVNKEFDDVNHIVSDISTISHCTINKKIKQDEIVDFPATKTPSKNSLNSQAVRDIKNNTGIK